MKSIRSVLLFIIIGISSIMISGCATKALLTIEENPRIQKAYLYDGTKQKAIIAKNQEDNNLTVYVSDMEQFGRPDYYNINIYNQVQTLKSDMLSGLAKATDEVPVDCDDTDVQMHIGLLRDNYPSDQMTANFYLVPPDTSDITGAKDVLWTGHLVQIVDVEGDYPMSLEDISRTRYQKDIEAKLGYYHVAYCPASEEFETGWVFVDLDGYGLLFSGEISVDEAKARPLYKAHTVYINQLFFRKDFE